MLFHKITKKLNQVTRAVAVKDRDRCFFFVREVSDNGKKLVFWKKKFFIPAFAQDFYCIFRAAFRLVEQDKVAGCQRRSNLLNGTGICHVYVDAKADFDKALGIIENAKTSRPSVCNAEEVLLVHSAVAEQFLPLLQKKLVEDRKEKGEIPVELRLCDRAAKIISGTPAGADDFDTEFLDYILAVKVVDSVEEAVEHISKHSTGHSEAIITESKEAADYFTMRVDSAAVYVNVSTRFTDGGEFGLGCEMGISTQKLHARGPMGLEELCTYKYIIRGEGQVR